MRPQILHSLFAPIDSLQGVGPKLRDKLVHLVGGDALRDMLFHMPSGVVDRRAMPNLDSVQEGQIVTTIVRVNKHHVPPRRTRVPYRIACSNDSGELSLVFFNGKETYLRSQLPEGEERVVSGRVEFFRGDLHMPHPDYMVPKARIAEVQKLEATYPLTQGITQRFLNKIFPQVTAAISKLPEWGEPHLLKQEAWPSWGEALRTIHAPEEHDDIEPESKNRMRLAYDELLANQLALVLSRERVKKQPGQVTHGDGSLVNALVKSLPFELTGGQQEVARDVLGGMAESTRMVRLLQGDVGAGKTVVALMALLTAVEAGKQAALMAPTDILARQHMAWIQRVIDDAGLGMKVTVALLTGRDKGARREEILDALQAGQIDILIGTHALFQDSVAFDNLAFVVIDEQHRFGVQQRLALTMKGQKTDMLLMTATPIPRTLTMTLYGDMEVSILRDKPAGRQPIDTRVMPHARLGEVVEGLKRAIAEGERVYWVCPRIEESDEADDDAPKRAAAEERYKALSKVFKDRVGLVHGKMKNDEKDEVMERFKAGELDVLVATTVIEVGVDVPEATIMVIEHAEFFGLSQLHQLRGRVGRGSRASRCVLLYGERISEAGKERMAVMRETEDGFIIAEKDLDLRGSGELLGTRQSGLPAFRLAQFPEHRDLLGVARKDVLKLLEDDPSLNGPRGEALRTLLYLFSYDSHVQYLHS